VSQGENALDGGNRHIGHPFNKGARGKKKEEETLKLGLMVAYGKDLWRRV